ncbi:MAG: TatD family hydrolase [Bacillota bacterium]
MPWLADSHAHLDFPQFKEDLASVLERAREAGLGFILNVATGEESSSRVVELCELSPLLWAAVGVHPHYAAQLSPLCLQRLAILSQNRRVLAIGETGLDYYRDHCPRDVQMDAFRAHLRLASSLDKPLIVHSREAHAETLRLMREEPLPLRNGIMHCFSGNRHEANAFLELGFYISVAGPVTYPRSHELRALMRAIPPERLLLETDAPYLSPQPFRSLRNEPAYIRATYERVALTLSMSIEKLAGQIQSNLLCLFPEIRS